jgi:ferric-dicitrate binding protein FerR (iron transport regulator)
MSKCRYFLFLGMVGGWLGCKEPARPIESTGKGGEKIYRSGTAKRTHLRLPDGTEVLMNAGAVLRLVPGFGKKGREGVLEGEASFTVSPGDGGPFVVRTKALVTTVEVAVAGEVSGNSQGDGVGASDVPVTTVFKVDGHPDSPGEEVDLLSGGLIVKKSYHSTSDNEPAVLGPGEMVMINTDIDLMEKEKFDTAELKTWMNVQ